MKIEKATLAKKIFTVGAAKLKINRKTCEKVRKLEKNKIIKVLIFQIISLIIFFYKLYFFFVCVVFLTKTKKESDFECLFFLFCCAKFVSSLFLNIVHVLFT